MKLKENLEIMAARKGLNLGQLAEKAGLGVDVTEIIEKE